MSSSPRITIIISLRAISSSPSPSISKPGSRSASPMPSPNLNRKINVTNKDNISSNTLNPSGIVPSSSRDQIRVDHCAISDSTLGLSRLTDPLNREEGTREEDDPHYRHHFRDKPKLPPPPILTSPLGKEGVLHRTPPGVNPNTRQSGGGDLLPVYYKYDGSRFDNAQTLKIQTGSLYEFFVILKPEKLRLGDVRMDEGEVKFLENDNVKKANLHFMGINENLSSNCPVYSFIWNTENYEATKKGERKYLQLSLEISTIGKFDVKYQLKVYPIQSKQHINWGEPLHYMEYQCQLETGSQKLKPYAFNIR